MNELESVVNKLLLMVTEPMTTDDDDAFDPIQAANQNENATKRREA